jgi:putative hydrolase of the HAD superfamily
VPIRAVMLDFYGTLARATQWLSIDVVLAEHGYELPDEVRERWWNGGADGVEHIEHSHSRDHYAAWRRNLLLAMLAETDVHPGEYELILSKLQAGMQTRILEPYAETHEILRELRSRGVHLSICSNWDWDLVEAVTEVGCDDLVDVMVSSAWAGARKPHPRIFEHTLSRIGFAADDVVFVGDTWGPDVVGPGAAGMRPVYLQRDGHWPDPSAPADPTDGGVMCIADLTELLPVVTDAAGTRR